MEDATFDGTMEVGDTMNQEQEAAGMPSNAEGPQPRGSFSLLPQDCLDKVLGFSTMHECLTFGLTSKTLMTGIRSDLNRRQGRMTQSFAYYSLPLGQFRVVEVSDGTDADLHCLPTVRDRVEWFSSALPRSHPLHDMARELLDDIDQGPTDVRGGNNESFQDALAMHRSLLRSHRLHATLLSDAIHADPEPWDDNERGVVTDRNTRELTTTLDLYIGYVLGAYYLMGHSIAGIVDGGPTENHWMDMIRLELTNTRRDPRCCYRAWIYLHSTLLRVAPFTAEQRHRMGIDGTTLAESTDSTLLQWPPKAFGCKNSVGRSELLHFLPTHIFNSGTTFLRVTLNDFGRLGPTYRGRDLIHSQTVHPAGLILRIGIFGQPALDDDVRFLEALESSSVHRSWRRAENSVLTWLLLVHGEANRVRPMTVTPPLVMVRGHEDVSSFGNR